MTRACCVALRSILLVLVVAGCATAAATPPPASALPHRFPDLEARLPAASPGVPVLTASYDGEFAIGSEDLYGGAFAGITPEFFEPTAAPGHPPASAASTAIEALRVAEAFLGPQYPYLVVRAFSISGADARFWDRVLERLLANSIEGESVTYSTVSDARRPTLEGRPKRTGTPASLVVVAGDTLYEVTGTDPAALRAMAATLP